MRKRPLLLIECVFLTGLFYQRYEWKPILLFLILFLLREWYYGRKTKNYIKMAGRSLVLLSAFFLSIFHMEREMEFRDTYMSKISDGSRVTVWGEINKTESTDFGYRGLLSNCYIDFGEGMIPCNDITVYTSNDHFQIGQIHKVTGKVKMFSRARNEGNFDALAYYQSIKVDFAIEEEADVLLGKKPGKWESFLLWMKQNMEAIYETCLSEKASGFYKAMVIGNKTGLDEGLENLFFLGGISHILAISGLHVSIFGRGIYRFLRGIGGGFGIAGICSSVVLISYCIMVGSSTSSIRAVGMMICFFLAQYIGRSYDMLNALGGMILILLIGNPFLIENSGFWFSVTAILGVGAVGTTLVKVMKKEKKGKLSGLWMSLGITLATLPVTAMSYYEVPLYSPLVNFLVLPFLTPVFALAVACGLLGSFPALIPLISLLLQPCEWLVLFYETVCETVGKLPWASIICGKPEWWRVLSYYAVLCAGIYMLQHLSEAKTAKRLRVLLSMLFFCFLCILGPKKQEPEISFLDVGQGDAIYISAGDGMTYFIDGGSSNVNEVGMYRILPFLKSRGVRSIDYWFVSHTDKDHISGLQEVLASGYRIKHLVLSQLSAEDYVYNNLRYAARDAGVEIIYMSTGNQICSEAMMITCVGPLMENAQSISNDKNENSLVLLMEYTPRKARNYKAMFAGDISIEVENRLCERGLLEDVDLLKANHHGSNYSNGEMLFRTICPEYIVVSCGKHNIYGHPGKKALERMEECGAKIFYTMEGGQITFPLIQ